MLLKVSPDELLLLANSLVLNNWLEKLLTLARIMEDTVDSGGLFDEVSEY